MFAEHETARAVDFADDINHFRLWHRDNVVREDLDIFFGRFGFHYFLQVQLGNRELAGRIKVSARKRNASPAQFARDSDAISRVLPNSPCKRQSFQQSLVSL